jgi:DNA polymerase II small subunit/DNA polymerase delta subunit B
LPAFKHADFNDRATAAAKAKQALIEKFKSRPGPDDPSVQAKIAERLAIAEAREKREAERRAAKEAEAARKAAEELERQAEAARKAAEKTQEELDRKADLLRIEAERKAARDARYAARKARKR